MRLLVGGNGLIGSAIRAELAGRALDFRATTRRRPPGEDIHLDLADGPLGKMPGPTEVSTLYLVAAMPGFAACEGSPLSWRVNVDAPIMLAQYYRQAHWAAAFVVFLSSDSVEWCNTAYARQKAQVESYMHTIGAAIVRPCRVTAERVAEFAKVVVDEGEAARSGVTRWK